MNKYFLQFGLALFLIVGLECQAASKPAKMDGQIFLKESAIPAEVSAAESSGQRTFHFANKPGRGTLYEREFARWLDPSTPPQSMTECVQTASGDIPFDGHWETCTGWATRWKYMYTSAYLRVATSDEQDIRKAVDECFQNSAVVGAVSAVASGGSAGLAAFDAAMKVCLASKLPTFVNLTIYTVSGWGDWQ